MKKMFFVVLSLVVLLSLVGCLGSSSTDDNIRSVGATTIDGAPIDEMPANGETEQQETTPPVETPITEISIGNDIIVKRNDESNWSANQIDPLSLQKIWQRLSAKKYPYYICADDDTGRASINAQGKLWYMCERDIPVQQFIHDKGIQARIEVSGECLYTDFYLDLPDGSLESVDPREPIQTVFKDYSGTLILYPDTVQLYHCGIQEGSWEIELNEKSFLTRIDGCSRVYDGRGQVFKLLENGETALAADHVTDAIEGKWGDMDFLTVDENGVLTLYCVTGYRDDILRGVITDGVKDARFVDDTVIFVKSDGVYIVDVKPNPSEGTFYALLDDLRDSSTYNSEFIKVGDAESSLQFYTDAYEEYELRDDYNNFIDYLLR